MAAKSANPTRPGRCEGEERKKALSVALANIEKQFGKGAITVSYTHLTLPTICSV